MAISLDEANTMVATAVAKAKEHGARITVVVTDVGGGIIAANRMDGSPMSSFNGANGKAKVSAIFGRSSALLMDMADRLPMRSILAASGEGFVPWQGALPVFRSGVLEGACGVGGASSEQDEECARTGITTVAGLSPERG